MTDVQAELLLIYCIPMPTQYSNEVTGLEDLIE